MELTEQPSLEYGVGKRWIRLNLAQMRQKAEMYCGVAIADDILLDVVNEALETIGDLAFIDEEIEITAPDDSWVELPETTTKIINVMKGDKTYQQWQTRGYSIKFVEPGTYTVTVQRMPNKVEIITDIPECHILFHKAIVTYLRGFVKLTKDDNNQDGHKLIEQFNSEIGRVAGMIQSNRKR